MEKSEKKISGGASHQDCVLSFVEWLGSRQKPPGKCPTKTTTNGTRLNLFFYGEKCLED